MSRIGSKKGACLHKVGGPEAGEVTRKGGVTGLPHLIGLPRVPGTLIQSQHVSQRQKIVQSLSGCSSNQL